MIPNGHPSTDTMFSATGRFASVPCSACGDTQARRSHRNGLVERMLSLLYVYPFRCQHCGHRFRSLQWGIRYHRILQDSGSHHHVETPVRASQFFSLH